MVFAEKTKPTPEIKARTIGRIYKDRWQIEDLDSRKWRMNKKTAT